MTRHPMFGLLLAGFGVLVLTPDTLFMRLSGMDNFAMLAWRGLLMGATLLLCWLALGRGGLKADLRALCTAAGGTVMLCQFFNAILFSYGVATAPVSIVLFGTATVPVFAALFAYLIIGEPTRRATWLAIAAVLSGIGIAVFGGGDGMTALDLAVLQGALAGLGVAATLALSFVVIRSAPDLPILPAIGTGAALAGALGLWIAGPADAADGTIWAIALTGVVILPVSFFSFSLASRYTHASNVSLLLLLETVLGPVWVWLGTGEAPTPVMALGGGIVIVSLAAYLLHTGRRNARLLRRARTGDEAAVPAGRS